MSKSKMQGLYPIRCFSNRNMVFQIIVPQLSDSEDGPRFFICAGIAEGKGKKGSFLEERCSFNREIS